LFFATSTPEPRGVQSALLCAFAILAELYA
jgi:hypothetical protein